mgnify:CR=1 FL=1
MSCVITYDRHNYVWPLRWWMKAVRGQKHQKSYEGVDLLKKVFDKSFSATSKPRNGSNQIWATTSG